MCVYIKVKASLVYLHTHMNVRSEYMGILTILPEAHWTRRPGSQFLLQFIPNSVGLRSGLKFFHTELAHPCLYGFCTDVQSY